MTNHNLIVEGQYALPRSTRQVDATVTLSGSNLSIRGGDQPFRFAANEYTSDDPLPGVACSLRFNDGSVFTPNDTQVRWPDTGKHWQLLTHLEQNFTAVVIAMVLIPLATYALIFKAIPTLAMQAALALPDDIVESIGEQSYVSLDTLFLEPTELDQHQQQQVLNDWQHAVDTLNLDDSKYRLTFAKSDLLGANALALPHGKIILTDQLVTKLADYPDATLGVILHEIGHVKHQHGMYLAIQSASTTLLVSVVFGDLELLSELMLGVGGTALQNSFSRDMEREADNFAFAQLNAMNKDPQVLGQALQAITDSGEIDDDFVMRYLSSHPSIKERIDAAKKSLKQP